MNSKFVLLVLCCLLLNCSDSKQTEQSIIFVKVPPFYNKQLSREENYYRFQHFLFPQVEIPNPVPEGLPNDDSLLYVSVDATGNIKLNSEDEGNISNTDILKQRLAEIFQERERMGAYETKNWKIVKVVGVKTADSIKYEDFIKVVEAVKQSGAEPIVLVFDNDARPFNYKNK